MMVTDKKRHEVAQKLRGLEICELDGEFIDCGEVEDALGLVSDDGAWYEAECVMHLADLIEPKPVEFDGINRNALQNVANQLLDDTAGLTHKDRAPYTAREIWVFAARILDAIGGY